MSNLLPVDIILSVLFIICIIIQFIVFPRLNSNIKIYLLLFFIYYIIYCFYNGYRLYYPDRDENNEIIDNISKVFNTTGLFFSTVVIINIIYNYSREPRNSKDLNKSLKSLYDKLFNIFYKKRTFVYKEEGKIYDPTIDVNNLRNAFTNSNEMKNAWENFEPNIKNYDSSFEKLKLLKELTVTPPVPVPAPVSVQAPVPVPVPAPFQRPNYQRFPPPGFPQGYPPQGYPQPGYPPPGYPPQGFPQGYPPPGYPQQNKQY